MPTKRKRILEVSDHNGKLVIVRYGHHGMCWLAAEGGSSKRSLIMEAKRPCRKILKKSELSQQCGVSRDVSMVSWPP
jgi:hypothetical protein